MEHFNNTLYAGNEEKYVLELIINSKILSDGEYTKKYQQWFDERLQPSENGVTILDLIFNEGPNAINFMESFK